MDSSSTKFSMKYDEEQTYTLTPQGKEYSQVLIFLHGLGYKPGREQSKSIAEDFLKKPKLSEIFQDFKIVIPLAGEMEVIVLNNKQKNSSWHQVKNRDLDAFERPFEQSFDASDVEASFFRLEKIIEKELENVGKDPSRVFLGGYSQGVGMAIYCANHLQFEIAGVIGWSGYYLTITKFQKVSQTQYFIAHGEEDVLRPWISVSQGYQEAFPLETIQIYQGMKHEFYCQEMYDDLEIFISNFSQEQK